MARWVVLRCGLFGLAGMRLFTTSQVRPENDFLAAMRTGMLITVHDQADCGRVFDRMPSSLQLR